MINQILNELNGMNFWLVIAVVSATLVLLVLGLDMLLDWRVNRRISRQQRGLGYYALHGRKRWRR